MQDLCCTKLNAVCLLRPALYIELFILFIPGRKCGPILGSIPENAIFEFGARRFTVSISSKSLSLTYVGLYWEMKFVPQCTKIWSYVLFSDSFSSSVCILSARAPGWHDIWVSFPGRMFSGWQCLMTLSPIINRSWCFFSPCLHLLSHTKGTWRWGILR